MLEGEFAAEGAFHASKFEISVWMKIACLMQTSSSAQFKMFSCAKHKLGLSVYQSGGSQNC